MRMLLILFIVLLAGCGYHTPGTSGDWVGGEARLLYIQLFDNQTTEPYLENFITDALVAELSRSRVLELTEDPEAADLLLSGVVNDFRSKALSYGTTDRITNYRATMKISARLLNGKSSEVLWRENLKRSEDYLAAVNKNLQLEGERLSAREVSKRLAEDIHAGLLNSF